MPVGVTLFCFGGKLVGGMKEKEHYFFETVSIMGFGFFIKQDGNSENRSR